ncbi:MAG: phage tail assembly protein [Anaerolineae bacterium]
MMMQTEFEFTLPRGYVDASGHTHKNGRMRLATALDEVEAVQDPRVQANESYLPILLLARVVAQLGTLTAVTPQVIAGLFASDLAYLQDLYMRLNGTERVVVGAVCPHCSTQFQLQVAPLG